MPDQCNNVGAAYASAQTAIAGAALILQGQRAAYALCRPPGHHAFAELAGGFCYLNNTAIAAQQLVLSGRKVAILDVDLHHGNGTQGIFYDRPDVLTVSIHAHPERYYPFFWGYPEERGARAGEGANLNLCLPVAVLMRPSCLNLTAPCRPLRFGGPIRWFWLWALTPMRAILSRALRSRPRALPG